MKFKLLVLAILCTSLHTVQAKQSKEVKVQLPPDMWSLRTGKALDPDYDCNMPEIVGDTEYPGDCPSTTYYGSDPGD